MPASPLNEEAQRAEPRAQISASEKVEPIYKAMQERDKERVDSLGSYDQRSPVNTDASRDIDDRSAQLPSSAASILDPYLLCVLLEVSEVRDRPTE